MKKFILSVILICVFLVCDAQKTTGGNYTYIAQRYEWLAGMFKALGLPAGSGPAAFTTGQEPRAGAVYYDSLGADAGVYIWSGIAWNQFGGGIDSVTYDTDSSYIWQGGDSFGIAKGGFFSPDQTSLGNTIHNGGGYNLTINNLGQLVLASNTSFSLTTPSASFYTDNFYASADDGIDEWASTLRLDDGYLEFGSFGSDPNADPYFGAYVNDLFPGTATSRKVAIMAMTAIASPHPAAYLMLDSLDLKFKAATYNFDGVQSATDTTTYKPTAIDASGNFVKFPHWPGGSGIDSSAYREIISIAPNIAGWVDLYGNVDTVEFTGVGIDSIYRTPGIDSFYYIKGDTTYAVKDSIGSGGGTSSFGIIQNATYTLTSSTSLQKLFDANTTGEITVVANTTYQFECFFSMSDMSATSGNCGFSIIGGGTATATSANWSVVGRDGGSLVTATNSTGMFSVNTAETGNIVAAATTTNMFALVKGTIRINGGGTIIPSVNLLNAAAAVVGANSYFKLTRIGSGSVTSW